MSKKATKKMCAIKNCANPKCPFPHPKQAEILNKDINQPKEKKVYAGAAPFNPNAISPFSKLSTNTPKVSQLNPNLGPKERSTPVSVLSRICLICSQDFIISIPEQEWYIGMDYSFPKRCKLCLEVKRGNEICL